MNHYFNPVGIYFGEKSVQTYAAMLRECCKSIHRVLILTRGGGVEHHESLSPMMSVLADKETRLVEVTLNNPDIRDVYHLMKEIEPFQYEMIVAIGGGSVIDAAKALAALQHVAIDSPTDVRDAITEEKYKTEAAFTPWLGIPTTAGTGSEVTCWATIWDEENGRKYSIADKRLYSKAALIVPELTVTMPLRLSVATALDALCHATEAYWSVNTNPISRTYSLQAIERIRDALPRLIEEPEQLKWRKQLALGSVLAGLSFSNTKTTACHSISYPLTMLYGIDHGIAASITLPAVLRHNYSKLIEPEKLLRAFGAKDVDGVKAFFESVYAKYELSSRLEHYGVTEEGISTIVGHAYTKGRMDNNPAPISPEELKYMLVSLL